MRGVSEVIAIILILMITISIAGLAYTFMSSTMASTTSAAASAVDTTTSSMLTSFTIESMDVSKVYVRNTGQNTISSLSVYVNDEPAVFSITPTTIASGQIGTVTIYNFLNEGDTVKITSPIGFSASKKVPDLCQKSFGCWKFDENGGTTAYDSSPYNKAGTLINGPVWASGKYGSALKLDGSNDYVLVTDYTPAASFSLSAWIYPNSTPTDSNIGQVIIANYAGDGFFLYLSNTLNVSFRTDSATSFDLKCNLSIPLRQWSFVASVFDSSTLRVYLNGNLCGSMPGSNAWPQSPIFIGVASHTGGVGNNFNGTIDEVRLYNRAIY